MQAGSACYSDPVTGYSVFTANFLRDKQVRCCRLTDCLPASAGTGLWLAFWSWQTGGCRFGVEGTQGCWVGICSAHCC